MDPINRFRAYIREQGLRRTTEREAIVEEIFSSPGHFDVDGLFLRLRNKKKQISKASVYRTLPLLIQSGLIREVYFEDGHLHYEQIYGHPHHCHLRCSSCGKVIEFADEETAKIEQRIKRRSGFVITDHRIELLGYCPECLKSGDLAKGKGRLTKERKRE